VAEFLRSFPTIFSFGFVQPDGSFIDFDGRTLDAPPLVWSDGVAVGVNLPRNEDTIFGGGPVELDGSSSLSISTDFAVFDLGGVPAVQVQFTSLCGNSSYWSLYQYVSDGLDGFAGFETVRFIPTHDMPPGFTIVPPFAEIADMPTFYLDANDRIIYDAPWLDGMYHIIVRDGILEPIERIEHFASDPTSLRMYELEAALGNFLRELHEETIRMNRAEIDRSAARNRAHAEQRAHAQQINDEKAFVAADFLQNFPTLLGFGIRQPDRTYVDLSGNTLAERPLVWGEWRGEEFWTMQFMFEDTPIPIPGVYSHRTSRIIPAVAQQFFIYEIFGQTIVQIEFWPTEGGGKENMFFHYMNGSFVQMEFVATDSSPPVEAFTSEPAPYHYFTPQFILAADGRLVYSITWPVEPHPMLWHVELHYGLILPIEPVGQLMLGEHTSLRMPDREAAVGRILRERFRVGEEISQDERNGRR
ncbi:MAG: hypothetical protein FWF77_00070, partial [Defluviitaleaceae bacterium]|nr:hypothetical protein [Defluviitaleaceae bacterium]